MKILFCSQAAHTGGGVETWLESLSGALAVRGWNVVTALAKGRFHDPVRYAQRHRVIEPVSIDGSSGLREDRILELRRLFERVKPDVIMPVNLADALLAAAYWKSEGANTRLAMCLHGQTDERIEQVRRCVHFIDLAASVSKRVASRLMSVIESERVRHIPAGVPLPIRDTSPRDRLQKIAYVGRLDSDKRIRDAIPLIRALRESEIEFHFAGTGPDLPHLQNELRNERVVFHGEMSRTMLYESIYPSVDAVIVFSEAETGPIVAWEAMIHGVVPVVSDYAGRSDENVIRHRETGLVFPIGDTGRAAELLLELTAPGSLHSLSANARAELPDAYTEPVFERTWDDALRATLAIPARRGTASDLPPLVSPGLIRRMGFGLQATSRLRRWFGRRHQHSNPGSEWPH